MPTILDFKLPDVGEGLTEAEILTWLVAVGDEVEVNQIIVEVETAKSAVELPCPWAGVVEALHCEEGDTVDVGAVIVSIRTTDASAGAESESHKGLDALDARLDIESAEVASDARTDETAPPVDATRLGSDHHVGGENADADPPQMLVGYGPGQSRIRARKPESVVEAPAASSDRRTLAKPPVRSLAKDLAVDLDSVVGSGPGGVITRQDVLSASSPAPVTGARQLAGPRETRVPIRGVRKHTAAAMVASAFTAPHVTEFVQTDVTELLALRARIAARPEFAEVRLSPLAFVARAVVIALGRHTQLNSTWDEDAGEIVIKHYVNLGIAAATERGLVVPNIKDAQDRSLLELAIDVAEVTAAARDGRASVSDMSGGTFTITSFGMFGVDIATPILNPGETGILAFGAIRRLPWVLEDTDGVELVAPRSIAHLAISFDHRVVDGEQGSKFLADVAGILADPGLALL